jgi:hypothetical protein
MTQFYSDPAREGDRWALPDCEVFYRTAEECAEYFTPEFEDDTPPEAGFYFWFCLPGCMPDSEPYGPYLTEQDAINAARDL